MTQSQTLSTWAIDPAHSEIQFKVKHLVISTVTGYFRQFSGEVKTTGEGFENAEISFAADVNSIDTNQEMRDNHLKSADFFAADEFPQLTFKSSAFEHVGGDDYKLTGILSIRGISKEVILDVEFGGAAVDGYGNQKAGFEINGKIKRKEFGLNWDAVTEAGGVVVSDEVKLHLNVQVNKAQ
ncbi:MAG: polyisoprenoid-binding protein [Bacteroidetes bacterium]|nr:MAG: polyisoprenoid-binding protein [Bacteroidota bacterium]